MRPTPPQLAVFLTSLFLWQSAARLQPCSGWIACLSCDHRAMIPWYPTPLSLVSIVFSWVAAMLVVYAWHNRAVAGISPVVLLLGDTLWLLGYGIATGTHDLATLIFWAKFQYLGMGILSVGLIAIAFSQSAHQRWLNPGGILLLALVPAAGALLAWTNEYHLLVWREISLDIRGGAALLNLRYGPFFYVYLAYLYCAAAFSALTFARGTISARGLLHRQSILLLAGLLLPWVGGLLFFLSGHPPFPGLDLTLVGLTITSLVIFWRDMDTMLLGTSPIPRDKVVEDMPDIVVVLDMHDRVVDINPAGAARLGRRREHILGYSLQALMPNVVERLRTLQNVWDTQDQITLGTPEQPIYFNMRITSLYNWRGKLHGRMGVLRDVSELHQREVDLRQARDELEKTNQQLISEMVSREAAQNQILEQQRLLAGLKERESLARDLHDGLGQVFGFIHHQVNSIRKALTDGESQKAENQLLRIAQVAHDSQEQMRDTIRQLKTPGQAERRFFNALEKLIERFSHDYSITVHLEINPEITLRGFEALVSDQLLNIIQEALTNAGKHSGARGTLIRFSEDGDQAEIRISDNGRGYDAAQVIDQKEHFGLLFMHERAQQAGGKLQVQPNPEGGTLIILHVPLRELIPGGTG